MSTLRVEALEQPDGTAFVFNNKNLLINGGMNVWQRGTNVTGINNYGYKSADRWLSWIYATGTWTQSRSTDVPSGQGFGYSMKWDCTATGASNVNGRWLRLAQKIEGQNLQHLLKGTSSAKALTLSFWVKTNKTGTYILRAQEDSANVSSRQISKTYTVDTANTWEKKTILIPGDTTGAIDNDNTTGLTIEWWLGAGSNYTSGTLNTSWNASVNAANQVAGLSVDLSDSTDNEWYITGIQLEVGSTASGFEFEPYASTLEKCQRYYFEQREGGIFGIANTTNVNFRVPLSVTMRVAPSASLGGSGFRIGDMISVGFFTTNPSIAVNHNGPTIAGVRVSGFGGLTAYRTYLLEPNSTYTGYIKLDAEL